MTVSYNRLWKLLIDKGMKKMDLKDICGLSSGTIAKMSRNEYVALEVLCRICEALDCRIEDVVEFVKN